MNFVQPATYADAWAVADDLTPEDLLEWKAACVPMDVDDGLFVAVHEAVMEPSKKRCYVLKDPSGDIPLLLGGWDVSLGVAWFVTTNEARVYPLRVLKALKECREEALKECPQLVNSVMKTNRMHVKLLDSLGAEWVGPIVSSGGEPFQSFIIKRKEDTQCATQ